MRREDSGRIEGIVKDEIEVTVDVVGLGEAEEAKRRRRTRLVFEEFGGIGGGRGSEKPWRRRSTNPAAHPFFVSQTKTKRVSGPFISFLNIY